MFWMFLETYVPKEYPTSEAEKRRMRHFLQRSSQQFSGEDGPFPFGENWKLYGAILEDKEADKVRMIKRPDI
ncbi:hypothetical protein TNCT_678931, partial [Trichonephila clavata]